MNGDYPQCNILFRFVNEKYEALELSQKTFVADKVNTDEEHLSVVKAYDSEIVVNASFFFHGEDMLLSLFYDHFCDIKDTVNETCACLTANIEENEEKQQRPTIGFTHISNNDEKNDVVACKK